MEPNGGSSMKVLWYVLKQKMTACVGVAIACSFFAGTALAEIEVVDSCGTVTVNGVPTSNVVITAWRCPGETNLVVAGASGSVMENGYNYHLLYIDGEVEPWVALEVSLAFMYGDCMTLVSCEEIAAAYEIDEKPVINVDIQCLGGGGGHTKGFWQNKNGQKLISDDDIVMLNDCCLRNEDGSDADFANKKQFKAWIKKARATNMSYMLSAQLAAMKLNVAEGFVDGGSVIYGPGCSEEMGEDYLSIDDLIAAANTALCENGMTVESGDDRDYQECLKSALDDANNNLNFVQP